MAEGGVFPVFPQAVEKYDAAIEEVAVMADQQHRPGILGQPLLR
jgi:hypothetical protein